MWLYVPVNSCTGKVTASDDFVCNGGMGFDIYAGADDVFGPGDECLVCGVDWVTCAVELFYLEHTRVFLDDSVAWTLDGNAMVLPQPSWLMQVPHRIGKSKTVTDRSQHQERFIIY
jgi:hypothetical protein